MKEQTNNFETIKEFYPDMIICDILKGVNKYGKTVNIDYTINNNFKETLQDLRYDGYSCIKLLLKGPLFIEHTAYFLISNLLKIRK